MREPIWKWLLGVAFAIIAGLSSIAYASMNARVADLETDRKGAVLALAEVKTELALVRQTAEEMHATLQAILDYQAETHSQLQTLLSSGKEIAIRNLRDSQKWNQLIDEQAKQRKK